MKPLIDFQNVHITFGTKKVLQGLDLKIFKGETLTILGGSGTGKSVTLRILLGILRPDQGEVFYRGRDVTRMREKELTRMRKHFGMLFQGSALFDSMSVMENIAYPLRVHFGHSEDKIAAIVAEKLKMVGLEGIEEMMPADLSGGMKKRVGLARAIATDPEVVLYDEPTTGLDPANTHRINNLIVQLQKKMDITSVVVTHDMDSAFFVSNRLALLKKGRICFVGSPEEAKNSDDSAVQGFIEGRDDGIARGRHQ